MNLKEELNQALLEFNQKLEAVQTAYKVELEQLNAKFQKLDQDARQELADKQQELIDRASELLNNI